MPRVVEASLKVTVPVGVPPYCPVTVEVKMTVCPYCDGFCDEVNVVIVFAVLIVTRTPNELLGAKLFSP
jgi:hypothetical protein